MGIALGLGGIPSGFSAGAPSFEAEIGLGGIPSGFSAGEPILSQDGLIFLDGIPSGFSAGSPSFAGSLQKIAFVQGIPSGFSAGIPRLTGTATAPVSAGGPVNTTIPLAIAAGVQTVVPSDMTNITVGMSLTIDRGASQEVVVVTGITGSFTADFALSHLAGAAVQGGGTNGLRINIGGSDRTSAMLRLGVSGSSASSAGSAMPLTMQSQTLGRWTSQWDLIDCTGGTLRPQMGDTVVITEPEDRLFAGCLTIIEIEPVHGGAADPGNPRGVFAPMIYHLTARDKSAICDRRKVVVPFFPAGMDIGDVFRYIVANYLDGEGITTGNVPPSGVLGPLLTNYTTPGQQPPATQVFDGLVTLYGGVWWIDTFGDLHTPVVSDVPDCPYGIATPTTNPIRGLRMVSDSVTYANDVTAVSNLRVIPGTSAGGALTPAAKPGVSISETYTLPQAAAEARGFDLGSIVTNYPIQAITAVIVNGVSQPFHVGTEAINFQKSWWYFPGAPNDFLYPPDPSNNSPGFPYPSVTSPYPEAGDVVEVQYIPVVPAAGSATGDPLAPGAGTCGSGKWQTVLQIQNVLYQGDLDVIAAAYLALVGIPQKVLHYETDLPGTAVGAKLHVDRPDLDLPDQDMLITAVTGATQGGTDLGHGTALRWTVTAVNGADQGNALKYWERVVNLLELPRPIDQQILPTLILAPGGDLSSGTVTTNPLIVGRTCQCTEIAISCFVGPLGQDMFIQVFDSASGKIMAAPMVIPNGAASEQVFLFDDVIIPGATWLFQNETITVTVAYAAAGPVLQFTIASGGFGYKVGDLEGGSPLLDDAFIVTAVNIAGVVTGLAINNSGPMVAGTYSLVNDGNITSSSKAAGGTGYAIGDKGTVDGGNGDATYIVQTIGAGGAVLTYQLQNAGTKYTTATAAGTTATNGAGTGLTLNLVAGAGTGLSVTIAVQAGTAGAATPAESVSVQVRGTY